MKKIAICFLFLLGVIGSATCGQTSKIELTDGSIINAEVVSLDNGTYTLNAGSLGEIKVEASKIKRIELKSENTASTPTIQPESAINASDPSNAEMKTEMAKYQAAVMNDPETLKIATDLAQDPQFQEIMKDPQVLEALKSGNMQALMSNPKFMNLINHPKIKEIGNKLHQNNP